jgi:hypothetical protein
MAVQPPRGEILKSNVDELESTSAAPSPRRRRIGLLVPLLVVAIGLVVLVAVLFVFAPPSQPAARRQPQPTASPFAPAAPKPLAAAGPMPAVRGISCDALESTLFHIHVHLAIFVNSQEQQVPYGVGVGQPWQIADTSVGPFVEDGSCFYWLHTHTQDGVVHIESPIRRTFTLGDFFAIWQQPLSGTQVGPAQGAVIAYLNGDRVTTNPSEIPLTSHALIQLDVGDDVPPYPYEFSLRE